MEDVFGVGFLVLVLLTFAYVVTRVESRAAERIRDSFRTRCEKVVGGYAVQDLAGKYRCVMNAE